MSEVDLPPIEAEVVLLRAEVITLRAENNDLQVKYAEVKRDTNWLIGVLLVLFAVVVALIAALVLEKSPADKKPGAKSLDETKPTGAGGGSLKPIFQLLRDLFEEEEVQRFVRTYLGPVGQAVIDGLSPHTSPDDLFHRIARALIRHGLVGDILFSALIEVRPLHKEYILRVRAECGVAAEVALASAE